MRHRNLFLALAFFGLSALANAQLVDSGTCGNGVTWEITGTSPNFTLTIGYDGVGTGVMTNYAAATDAPWDTYRADITTLVIENGITDIGDFTMPDMPNVTNPLTLPATLTRIGQYAFTASGFTGNLIIPEGVTSIEMGAFRLCTGLDGTLTIPASVTSIGERAFRGCTNITEVINNRFEPQTIDANVFQEVSLNNLTLNVLCEDLYGDAPVWQDFGTITGGNDASCPTAPFMSGNCGNGVNWEITGTMPNFTLHIIYDGVGTGVMNNYLIGTTPWYGQRANLKTLVIDNGVTVIANTAFADCWNLSGNLTIPNSVTSIGENAFYGCGNFTGSLIISNSVTSIGNSAFNGCQRFSGDLTIPNSVMTIGSSAFRNCNGFTGTLTIPASVTSIGDMAFRGCTNLNAVTNNRLIPQEINANVFQEVSLDNLTLNVPCEDLYGDAPVWQDFGTITGGNDARCPSAPSLGGNCGDGVFWTITGTAPDLTLHIVYDGVGTGVMMDYNMVGDAPYYNYRHDITTLIIDEGITHFGVGVFYGFTNLTGNLVIPNSVTSIGSGAFGNCGFTGTLTIPNSVTSIGGNAFYFCSGLNEVIIGNSVTSIGSNTFNSCSGLNSLIIGNSVASIGSAAFYNCSGLKKIISLATSPPSLDPNAFLYVPATIPVYVPCVALSDYRTDWSYFSNIYCGYQLTVLSNDYSLGGVSNYGMTAENPATLYAVPKPNAVFTQWNDDNTDNPRTVTLTSDSTFTAIFIVNPLIAQVAELEADTAALNLQIAGLENDLTDCNNANTDLQNDLADCNNANDGLQDQITTLTDALSDCNDEKANLQNDLTDCNTANDALQDQITMLTDALSDCNNENATLQNDLTDCNNANDTLQDQITTLTDELSDCNDANATLQNDLTDCNSENDTLQDQITTLTDELSDCNDANEVLQGYLEECETERDNLQQLLDDCLSGIDSESMRSGLIIYPNPVSSDGVLYIANETLQKGDKIEIFDMSGKLLSISYAQGSETFIHIGVLPQGTYLLRLAGQKGVRFEVR